MKSIAHKEKHEFALHIEGLATLLQGKKKGDELLVSHEALFHRLVTVLRLQPNEQCIFFDRNTVAVVKIISFIGKKNINCAIESIEQTKPLEPTIIFLLPILKRDDLESALYSLVEIGANTIQLVSTQKSAQQFSYNRDKERIQRIVIAAAEQSKNFAYPEVKAPFFLSHALQEYNHVATKIFFDPAGKKMFDVMQVLHQTQPLQVLLLIGPEGDLNEEEKKMVQINNFIVCAFTPTILRAKQAAVFAAGFVRSILVSKSF